MNMLKTKNCFDKVWLGAVFMFGMFGACNPRNQTPEVINESKREEVVEVEQIDIAAKLASGESFRLPAISGCNYDNDGEASGILVEAPSARQLIQISEILKYSGLPSNFKILKTVNSIANAFAAIVEGQRVIIFDEELLRVVDDRQSQEYWASMSILAHEIGHHLSGHTLDAKGSNHMTEMEADKFSGFVLYKMGASVDDAIYAMEQIGSEIDFPSHPSKYKRVEYIKEGWNEANRQRYYAALPPPPDDDGFNNLPEYFAPHQLLDTDMYESLYGKDNYYSYSLIEDIEGVIVSAEESNTYFFYEIMITSIAGDQEYLKKDKIFNFAMNDPFEAHEEMHHLNHGLLIKKIMVPGRKLKFSLSQQGNRGGYIITEIETLARD